MEMLSGRSSKSEHPVYRCTGATPILMSSVVLAMIAYELLRDGFHAPRRDEDAADHVAIILMFGQLPIILSFVVFGWRKFRRIAPVLVVQVSLWLLTFAAAQL